MTAPGPCSLESLFFRRRCLSQLCDPTQCSHACERVSVRVCVTVPPLPSLEFQCSWPAQAPCMAWIRSRNVDKAGTAAFHQGCAAGSPRAPSRPSHLSSFILNSVLLSGKGAESHQMLISETTLITCLLPSWFCPVVVCYINSLLFTERPTFLARAGVQSFQ